MIYRCYIQSTGQTESDMFSKVILKKSVNKLGSSCKGYISLCISLTIRNQLGDNPQLLYTSTMNILAFELPIQFQFQIRNKLGQWVIIRFQLGCLSSSCLWDLGYHYRHRDRLSWNPLGYWRWGRKRLSSIPSYVDELKHQAVFKYRYLSSNQIECRKSIYHELSLPALWLCYHGARCWGRFTLLRMS